MNLNLIVKRLLSPAELIAYTLVREGKMETLRRVKTHPDMLKAINSLITKKVFTVTQGVLMLADNNFTKSLAQIRTQYDLDNLTIFKEYFAGKFLFFKNRYFPLMTTKSLKSIKDYLNRTKLNEDKLLEALKFYYDDLKESEVRKGKHIILQAKSVNNILLDEILMTNLLYRKIDYEF